MAKKNRVKPKKNQKPEWGSCGICSKYDVELYYDKFGYELSKAHCFNCWSAIGL